MQWNPLPLSWSLALMQGLWMLKPRSKGACKHNIFTFERFLFYSKPSLLSFLVLQWHSQSLLSHSPAWDDEASWKGSLSSEEQPKKGCISKNTSRGLFTLRDKISGRKSLRFCLGFCLSVWFLLVLLSWFGFVSFGSLGWFWDFLLGVSFLPQYFQYFLHLSQKYSG